MRRTTRGRDGRIVTSHGRDELVHPSMLPGPHPAVNCDRVRQTGGANLHGKWLSFARYLAVWAMYVALCCGSCPTLLRRRV